MLLRWVPDAFTVARFFASPLLAWLLLRREFRLGLALVAVAGMTDWLDGFLARKLGVTGKVGAVLDPLADKTLLVTLFLALGILRLVPMWMLGLAIGRDLIIVSGSLLLRIFRNRRRFVPTMLGKISTFFQIAFVLLVLDSSSRAVICMAFMAGECGANANGGSHDSQRSGLRVERNHHDAPTSSTG